jgi:1,6-anhydro-N-acetylmuramate kinase
MAEISIIAAKTGITSLSNFRVSDMALGRQGCPLFVAWDGLCATHPTKNVAVQNIGGIANITVLPKGDPQLGYDFDTGPGNVYIDAAVRYFTNGERQYDKDGAMGAAGKVDQAIVDEVLQHPYFLHDIPKTTGRETFGDDLSEELCKRMTAKGASPEDCVATITRITAQSLAEAYKRWGPQDGIDEIYLGGGGSYNPNIINYLRQQLPKTKIQFLDVLGVPCGSREAMSFSFKGLECVVGRSLIVPKRVESDRAGIIGHIQPGSGLSYHRLIKHVQDFWGDWPLEKRMDPVLKMDIVRDVTNGNGH